MSVNSVLMFVQVEWWRRQWVAVMQHWWLFSHECENFFKGSSSISLGKKVVKENSSFPLRAENTN